MYKETSNGVRICSKLSYSKHESDVYTDGQPIIKALHKHKNPQNIHKKQFYALKCTIVLFNYAKTIQNEQNMQN